MITEPVLLADRFEIRPAFNAVRDRMAASEIRLEARIMALLCLLMENEGCLVSREYITKEIWDDYGNADEGLTQSISYLRKVLGDEQKKLIETVPKKGYILRAKVSEITTVHNDRQEGAPAIQHRSKKSMVMYVVSAVAIVIVLFLTLRLTKREGPTGPDLRPDMENTGANPDKASAPREGGADVVKDSGSDLANDTLKKN